MASYTEPMRPYEFVLCDHGNISYDTVTLNSGSGTIVAGSVLGRISKRQAAAPIPTIVGTGSGVMTLLTFGPDVQVGSYVITLTETSATAAYTVVAPDGTSLPDGAVATAYKSSHLSFLIANGGTMTVGDAFTVVVTASGTPVLVGTGSGVVSAVSLGKLAEFGVYRVKLTATGATALFEVRGPSGLVGTGNVATAFTSDHVNFSLANGGTMTLGDYFNIIVAGYTAPEGLLWDPAAVNGVNEVYGIATHGADASGTVAVLTRLAEVKSAALTWKSTVAAAQKTEAYRQMAANNLIVRS